MPYDLEVLISDSHRALFIHVQKTGGVTIRSLLETALPDARKHRKPVNHHATLAQVLEREPELGDYWTFGFVRNPWSRLVSWYDMVQRFKARADEGRSGSRKHLVVNPFLGAVARDYPTFEDFVLRGPEDWERLRMPQLDYLRTAERRVDFVGRTESLNDDMHTVYRQLGLAVPEDVPRKNKTVSHGDWRDNYTDRTRERVGELFAADVEEFGYEF